MEKFLSKKWVAMLGAGLCTVLWGSAYPVIKYGYLTFGIQTLGDKLMFAGARFLIAGMMVFILALILRRRVPTVPKKKVAGVILYGILQTGLMYILNYIGVANTSATKTSILTAASAFFAVLFAPLFFRSEDLSALKVIGVVIGLSGIIAINLGELGGFALMGEGLVLTATLLNTAGAFIGKRVSQGRVFEATAYQLMTGGALIFLAAIPLGGGFSISWASVGVVLYLAFVSSAAFSLWTALLVYHDAGRILVFNLLIPITGAMWSYLILGEEEILDPMYAVSITLVAVGILLVNYQKKSVKKPFTIKRNMLE